MNHAEIKNVSGTAFVVAEFRAEENEEEYPLYQDSVVGLFLNEDTRLGGWVCCRQLSTRKRSGQD